MNTSGSIDLPRVLGTRAPSRWTPRPLVIGGVERLPNDKVKLRLGRLLGDGSHWHGTDAVVLARADATLLRDATTLALGTQDLTGALRTLGEAVDSLTETNHPGNEFEQQIDRLGQAFTALQAQLSGP